MPYAVVVEVRDSPSHRAEGSIIDLHTHTHDKCTATRFDPIRSVWTADGEPRHTPVIGQCHIPLAVRYCRVPEHCTSIDIKESGPDGDSVKKTRCARLQTLTPTPPKTRACLLIKANSRRFSATRAGGETKALGAQQILGSV